MYAVAIYTHGSLPLPASNPLPQTQEKVFNIDKIYYLKECPTYKVYKN